jgi:hypothetical protein
MTDMAAVPDSPHAAVPLRQGTDRERAVLRELLARAHYNEHDVCERVKLTQIHEIDNLQSRVRLRRFDDGDVQALLVRLFLLGVAATAAEIDRALTQAERDALLAVDLLRIEPGTDVAMSAPVRLAPIATSGVSVVLASDRAFGVDGGPMMHAADVVFPPQSLLTRQFLDVLPTPASGSVLDLCTGSGVAALIVGHRASRVVAVDVTARSGHFARFNTWLNDAAVDVRVGDLYAPLGDERFTWIVAHPPYVPSQRPTAVFRDGGELGDVVVRGIVAGLPQRLEVGGVCYIVTQGMDMADGRFEEQARRWMGEAGRSFDIVFAMSQPRTIEGLAATLVAGAVNPEPDHEERSLALFREHGVTRFVHGALVLRRLPDGVVGESQRVAMHPSSRATSFERVFEWMAAGRSPRFIERLLTSTPKVRDGTRLDVINVFRDGDFTPQAFRLSNGGDPFPATIDVQPWVVRLVMTLDGRRSLAEALALVRDAGHLPEGFTQADADVVLRYLAERGVLEIELPV